MAKKIILFRHTDNDDDVLSPDGVEAAVELGRTLEGDVDLGVSTGAQRATQALACMLAGAGRTVAGGVVVEEGLRSQVEDRWRAAYEEAGGGELDDFERVAPDLVDAEANVLGAALRQIADRLEDGQRALVVGHSPSNEVAVLGFSGQRIASQGKGEAVELTVDGDRVTVQSGH